MTSASFKNPTEDDFEPVREDLPHHDDPPWLKAAFTDVGVKEVPGQAAHPRIVQMHGHTTLKATSDEVAWCSAAMCTWMEESGIPSTRSAAARSWMTWGQAAKGERGDVVVFWRGTPSGWSGHVAIVVEPVRDGMIQVIGGNQSDGVRVSGYSAGRILGYRRPE